MIAAAVIPSDGVYICLFDNGEKKTCIVKNGAWYDNGKSIKHFNFKYLK